MVASGLNLRANILQAPHHGSRSSSTPDFVDAVNPNIVVISVGAGNIHGHPHPEVLDIFSERGIDVYRTDQLGHIVFRTNGERIYHYSDNGLYIVFP
jgi:competence protein ComEC